MLMALLDTLPLRVEVSSLSTRIASSSGLIRATLTSVRCASNMASHNPFHYHLDMALDVYFFRHLRELGGHDVDDEGQERQCARAARRAAGFVNRAQTVEGNGDDGIGAPGIAGAGQIISRNAENVAAHLEMQAARLKAHVEQMFEGHNDADGP